MKTTKLLRLKPFFQLGAVLSTWLSAWLLTARSVAAQITNPVIEDWGELEGSCDAAPLFVEYFILVWKAIISLGAIVVLVMFIYGAIEWLSSSGDSAKLAKARTRMLHAALGMLILVASFSIISFVSMIFFGENFDILNFTLPTGLECSSGGGGSGGGGSGGSGGGGGGPLPK